MLQSLNFPLCAASLAEAGGWTGLARQCSALGLDGIEGIWAGEDIPADLPDGLLTGYHLTFLPDWLDAVRQDRAALAEKFGSAETGFALCGIRCGGDLLDLYRADLDRARHLKARYVVFHISDVSLAECFTYRWLHSHEEVIDAALDFIGALLENVPPDFDFLVENQWWPGFTFTDPRETERLLSGIAYPRAGLLLDTGHLMNAFPELRTQTDGLRRIHQVLDAHGSLCSAIRGVHLHQSLSGPYVRTHTGKLPEGFSQLDPAEQFRLTYAHVCRIDRHRPWTHPGVRSLVDRIGPRYLTHELTAACFARQVQAVRRQLSALGLQP